MNVIDHPETNETEEKCPPNCDHKWDSRCKLSCYADDESYEET